MGHPVSRDVGDMSTTEVDAAMTTVPPAARTANEVPRPLMWNNDNTHRYREEGSRANSRVTLAMVAPSVFVGVEESGLTCSAPSDPQR